MRGHFSKYFLVFVLAFFQNISLCFRKDDEEGLEYDLHFWIGKYSTQDEYGTAAYKTVELDTYHGDKPIQHREVSSRQTGIFMIKP